LFKEVDFCVEQEEVLSVWNLPHPKPSLSMCCFVLISVFYKIELYYVCDDLEASKDISLLELELSN